jgi:hypothetical protein
MGPHTLLHQRSEGRPEANQRPVGDDCQVGHVQGGISEAPLPAPAMAYYKVPFAVARLDGDPVAFGGIWEEWGSPTDETLRTFATITTDSGWTPHPL